MDGWMGGWESQKAPVHGNDQGIYSLCGVYDFSLWLSFSHSICLFFYLYCFSFSLFASWKTDFGSKNVRADIWLPINSGSSTAVS